MSLARVEPAPFDTEVVESSRLMQSRWVQWLLRGLIKRVEACAHIRATVSLTDQKAAIGATPLLTNVAAGLYRVSWRLRIDVADGVSSSVILSIASTEGGHALSVAGADVNGDTTSSVQTGVVNVRPDVGSSIFYSATYASNTAEKMRFVLDLAVEQLS